MDAIEKKKTEGKTYKEIIYNICMKKRQGFLEHVCVYMSMKIKKSVTLKEQMTCRKVTCSKERLPSVPYCELHTCGARVSNGDKCKNTNNCAASHTTPLSKADTEMRCKKKSCSEKKLPNVPYCVLHTCGAKVAGGRKCKNTNKCAVAHAITSHKVGEKVRKTGEKFTIVKDQEVFALRTAREAALEKHKAAIARLTTKRIVPENSKGIEEDLDEVCLLSEIVEQTSQDESSKDIIPPHIKAKARPRGKTTIEVPSAAKPQRVERSGLAGRKGQKAKVEPMVVLKNAQDGIVYHLKNTSGEEKRERRIFSKLIKAIQADGQRVVCFNCGETLKTGPRTFVGAHVRIRVSFYLVACCNRCNLKAVKGKQFGATAVVDRMKDTYWMQIFPKRKLSEDKNSYLKEFTEIDVRPKDDANVLKELNEAEIWSEEN